MKKFLSLGFVMILISLFLVTPAKALTASDVYYQLSTDPYPAQKLYVKSEVCKVANCLTAGAPTDWYNYSTTSNNVSGDSGAIQTLTVKPGDTVTFRDSTWFTRHTDNDKITVNPEDQLNAYLKYGVKFTNGSFLTFGDKFSHVIGHHDDVDQNDNLFQYNSDNDIPLTENLISYADPEVGAITATINNDTPDGTIITGTFYLVGLTYQGAMAPARALAAEDDSFVRSVARIQVSNPAPEKTPEVVPTTTATTTTTTTTMPKTGSNAGPWMPYLFLVISIALAFVPIYIGKRAKK